MLKIFLSREKMHLASFNDLSCSFRLVKEYFEIKLNSKLSIFFLLKATIIFDYCWSHSMSTDSSLLEEKTFIMLIFQPSRLINGRSFIHLAISKKCKALQTYKAHFQDFIYDYDRFKPIKRIFLLIYCWKFMQNS